MIVYTSSTGTVIGWVAGSDLNGITHIPSSADFAVSIDDTTFASLNTANTPGTYTITGLTATGVNKYNFATATGTPVFTPLPDADQLTNAKTARKAYLLSAFNNAIGQGFPSSADSTARTYALDPIAMGKWTGTLANINSGALTVNTQVKDIAGNKVTLTVAQYKTFAMDGFDYYNTQEQNYWTKEDDVDAIQLANYANLQAAVNAVNAVVY